MRSIMGLSLCLPWVACATPASVTVPSPNREMRAAWVATVDNIDWPSQRGLAVEDQKKELMALLDRASELHLNAIVFQVRPCGDVFYGSPYEPWSEYLTGTMGKAPEPFYDPLALAVEEAHRRGIELHAWFNPFRAHHPSGKSPISAKHISRARPALVREYGKHLWMDPGEKEVRAYAQKVILDVVRRYDIDGVHLDDYFYPYREKDSLGREIPFPDDASWKRYRTSGGRLSRDDWRRNNVDTFVHDLYRGVKKEKKWVKVGISPFGIWRPGNPPQIKGLDAYSVLYADARKWIREGWMDYCTPQIYWQIDPPAQSFPVLLDWWIAQNGENRHIWPGIITSRVFQEMWKAGEIIRQIQATRLRTGSTGHVHFSIKPLLRNSGEITDSLKGLYAEPALVPASPWLGKGSPGMPAVQLAKASESGDLVLRWTAGEGNPAWLWVVQVRAGRKWHTEIVPGSQGGLTIRQNASTPSADVVAVTAVDRVGVPGKTAVTVFDP